MIMTYSKHEITQYNEFYNSEKNIYAILHHVTSLTFTHELNKSETSRWKKSFSHFLRPVSAVNDLTDG